MVNYGATNTSATLKALQGERMKTFAIGATGTFAGVGVGEFAGRFIGAMVAPTSVPRQHQVSAIAKLFIGGVVLIINGVTGLPGLFLLGLGFGVAGSAITDAMALATKGGLPAMAYAAAKQLRANTTSIQSAADVLVESAASTEQARRPQTIVTVAE